METYDLRGAVETSHFELVKDINWYIGRGGNNRNIRFGNIALLDTYDFNSNAFSRRLVENAW